MGNRVVITGMGAVSPIGNNVDSMWENMKNGANGIGFIDKFDTEEFKVKIGGQIKDLDISILGKEARRMDEYCQYGMIAANEAVLQSGIIGTVAPEDVAVYVGSGIGGLESTQNEVLKMEEKGPRRVSPVLVPVMISNILAGRIAIEHNFKGSCIPIVTACATGTNSIGEAYRHIKDGYAIAAVAGGAEASLTKIAVAAFANMKALSTTNDPNSSSCPFTKNRDGFVMSEGGGVVVIEEYEHAKSRGAKIFAEIVGYGSTCDAYHITSPAPDGEGAARAMKQALADAKITGEDVQYINAHGTSTEYNDLFETMAIKTAFGDAAYTTQISSTKSMTGHMLGAAGGIEAIACVCAINDSFLPPTIHYDAPDEKLDLDYIPNVGRKCEVEYALSNSLGFGGHNGTLIFKKYSE